MVFRRSTGSSGTRRSRRSQDGPRRRSSVWHALTVRLALPRRTRRSVDLCEPAGEYGAFTDFAQKLAAELHNVVLSDQVVYQNVGRDRLMQLLREHITTNLVKVRPSRPGLSSCALTSLCHAGERALVPPEDGHPARLGLVKLAVQPVLRRHGAGQARLHQRRQLGALFLAKGGVHSCRLTRQATDPLALRRRLPLHLDGAGPGGAVPARHGRRCVLFRRHSPSDGTDRSCAHSQASRSTVATSRRRSA